MTDLVPPEDIRVSVYPLDPPGGQHAGLRRQGVEVEHLPSGTIARVSGNRSQHINKMIAMDMILSAITHPRFRL